MIFNQYSIDNLLLNNGKNFVKAFNLDKVLIDVETHSPDCSGNPFLKKKIATESGK